MCHAKRTNPEKQSSLKKRKKRQIKRTNSPSKKNSRSPIKICLDKSSKLSKYKRMKSDEPFIGKITEAPEF